MDTIHPVEAYPEPLPNPPLPAMRISGLQGQLESLLATSRSLEERYPDARKILAAAAHDMVSHDHEARRHRLEMRLSHELAEYEREIVSRFKLTRPPRRYGKGRPDNGTVA
jgi:hypothetical protein